MKKIISIILVGLILLMQIAPVFANEDETYYVQVGAFKLEKNATKYTNYMTGIGYDAVTIKVFDLYKVFLGPYETEARAKEILTHAKSNNIEGFFVKSSEMYYKTDVATKPMDEVADKDGEETTEEETTEEVVEETTEEETTEEVVEETTEEETTEEEKTEEVVEKDEVKEEIEEPEEVVVEETDDEEDKAPNYRLFTIVLIVVLWVLFGIIVVIYRLNHNKKKEK